MEDMSIQIQRQLINQSKLAPNWWFAKPATS